MLSFFHSLISVPTMMPIYLSARVITTHPFTLSLDTTPPSCQRCAEGGGCAQNETPWFRARLPETFTLPDPEPKRFAVHDSVQLQLDPRAMTVAAIISYGVPLLAFFIGLLLGRGFSEGAQLGLGLGAMLTSAWATKRFETWWLRRYLRVMPCQS